MPDRDRGSRCILSVTLFMFLLALAADVTPVADLDGTAHQSTTAVLDTKRGGMLAAGTPRDPIAIDGDANFADTALLEGWDGDGSPENPYIIESLDIDLGGAPGNCIGISNTRVSFTIRNCNLTGAGQGSFGEDIVGRGIYLENVTNGELVNNACNYNTVGISFGGSNVPGESYSNTVAHNNCTSNEWYGIYLHGSDSNTVVNNTCVSNVDGIRLYFSSHNTVANNTCNSNGYGIHVYDSDSNTVANNTCTSNGATGIFLYDLHFSTVVNNICNSNDGNGIGLGWSDSNIVDNNICSSNTYYGIHLYESNNNNVENNICNNNRIGIYLVNSLQNTVAYNICSFNSLHPLLVEFETEEFEVPEISPEVLLLIGFAVIIMLGARCGMAKLSRAGVSETWIGGYAISDHRRLICSRCGATYLYGPQHAIRTGVVRCQNCDQEFLSGATG